MRRHLVEAADAAMAEAAAHLFDLLRVAVERMAHHQEYARGAKTCSLGGYGFGCWLAKHDLVHLSEDDTSRRMHVLLPMPAFRSAQPASRCQSVSGERQGQV